MSGKEAHVRQISFQALRTFVVFLLLDCWFETKPNDVVVATGQEWKTHPDHSD